MKPTLQCQIGQQLTIAPQLQHAIKLLHMSAVELQEEVQKLLESNPMLEVDEQATQDAKPAETTPELPLPSLSDQDFQTLDNTWPDFTSRKSFNHDAYDPLEFSQPEPETLQAHLAWQCRLTPLLPEELIIAETILDAIDDDGYLTNSLAEIHVAVNQSIATSLDAVERVLSIVQSFEPYGVGARDLKECLHLQLKHSDYGQSPEAALAMRIVDEYLTLLGQYEYGALAKKCGCTKAALKNAIALIKSLHPKPGRTIGSGKVDYIIPDVVVFKEESLWQVRLNRGISPKVKLNEHYMQFIKRADNSRDNTFLRDNLKEARWFLKSLENRNDTLLRVARCIVAKQQAFLEEGEAGMKPLVLQDVAKELELHESTVSRITTQKFLHTPRGVFELKYFFSSHVSSANGTSVSSTAIRALLKRYIATEEAAKPYSDNKLACMLKTDHGIEVARRTVTKYREAMMILPSNERKRQHTKFEAD